MLLGGVYAAPWIVALSPPVQAWILQTAVPLHGSIHIESLSLDWLSGISAEKLTISDAAGEPLLEIESLARREVG